jgi:bifunctional UDP-N-acetylglucosamine pyrophosphorylase/glucosamine-1-phosphate N-acetyltransferase
MTPIDILIMAAKGTRMKSRTPKVLQRLAGRPLLHHVLDQAAHLQARSAIVITGHGATEVEAATAGLASVAGQYDLKFVRQEPQLGTGHAVQQAVPCLADDGTVVVLSGDVPLTQAAHCARWWPRRRRGQLALLTVRLPDPTGYGRILRDGAGQVRASSSTRTPAKPSVPSMRSTAASWPCLRACSSPGWRA